jgi:hypothetical protein
LGDVGLKWSDIDNDFFPLRRVYHWLIIDFFIYFALALWLDNVLPGTKIFFPGSILCLLLLSVSFTSRWFTIRVLSQK